MAYLPGGVVQAGDDGNAAVCIDIAFHQQELDLLTELGAVAQPVIRSSPPEETWVRAYKDLIQDQYIAAAQGSKPQPDKLLIKGEPPPWPLEALPLLSAKARAVATTIALGLANPSIWSVRHSTNPSYQTLSYKNPLFWWLHRHGRLDTTFGPMQPGHCIIATDEYPDDILPVVSLSSVVSEALQLKTGPEALPPEAWTTMTQRVTAWPDARRASRFYAWAAYYAPAPAQIVAQMGNRAVLKPPADVAVSHSEETYHALAEQNLATILVEDDADFTQLIENWGLEDGRRLLEQELVFEASGEPQVLVDLFPKLRLFLDPGAARCRDAGVQDAGARDVDARRHEVETDRTSVRGRSDSRHRRRLRIGLAGCLASAGPRADGGRHPIDHRQHP